MSGRSIGQNIDQPGNHAIYSVPILDIGTFQTRMKGDGRKVDDQVARATAGSVGDHSVMDCFGSEDF